MDRKEAQNLANDAKNLSQQGLELIQQGKYREGHNLIRQAVEAGRKCRNFLEQPKVERGLGILERMHKQG
ncbi:MAG: hypothetical protein IGS23_05280 [Rivularia sp. T60_A2020_040]|nr:hypothetical protein [Rivularia sp. T60_A2020_040]